MKSIINKTEDSSVLRCRTRLFRVSRALCSRLANEGPMRESNKLSGEKKDFWNWEIFDKIRLKFVFLACPLNVEKLSLPLNFKLSYFKMLPRCPWYPSEIIRRPSTNWKLILRCPEQIWETLEAVETTGKKKFPKSLF